MKPLKDFVLVVEVKGEDAVSAGGIIMSGAAPDVAKPAIVLAVGPEVEGIEAGDKVVTSWAGVVKVRHEGEKAGLLPAESIMAVY
jgi:co-chaperonin GroES (HSP10)